MNITVLRPGAIGDSLLTFPILAALRVRYTDPHITYVSVPPVLPLAKAWGLVEEAFSDHDMLWNEIFSTGGIQQAALLNILQGSDLAVFWYWFRDADEPVLVRRNLLTAGAREAIVAHMLPPTNAPKHVTEYLAETISLTNFSAVYVAPMDTENLSDFRMRRPIAIHVGATDPLRLWPAASFATVINRLLRMQCPILLLVGPNDTEQFNNVYRRLSTPSQPGLLKILQNAPLLEVAREVKQCRCFLGNDSGMAHLAALLGIPTIALFLPRNVVYTRPLGPLVEILQADPLKRVSVGSVLEKTMRHI